MKKKKKKKKKTRKESLERLIKLENLQPNWSENREETFNIKRDMRISL